MDDNDGGFKEQEVTEDGYQLVGTGSRKGKKPAVPASSKGQGFGVMKVKFEKRRVKCAESDSAGSVSAANGRKAAKDAGNSSLGVAKPVQQPQHAFFEVMECFCKCCTDAALLENPEYIQPIAVLLAKYGIDEQVFVQSVASKDVKYFAKVLIRGAEPYPQTPPLAATATS